MEEYGVKKLSVLSSIAIHDPTYRTRATAALIMEKYLSETEKRKKFIYNMTRGKRIMKKMDTTNKDNRRRHSKTISDFEVSPSPAVFAVAPSLSRSELSKLLDSSGGEVWTESFPHGRWGWGGSSAVSPRRVWNQAGKLAGKQAVKQAGIQVWSADRTTPVKYDDDNYFSTNPPMTNHLP